MDEILIAIEHLKMGNYSAYHMNLAIKSLEMQYKMMKHCEGSCEGCQYNNPFQEGHE